MLYAQSVVAGAKENAIAQEVFYPKYQSRENYDRCLNTVTIKAGFPDVGYGGLVSVTFTSLRAARVFYDSLQYYKGANVGSVVTLAIPLVTYSFQGRLEWAKDHDLEENQICYTVLFSFFMIQF